MRGGGETSGRQEIRERELDTADAADRLDGGVFVMVRASALQLHN